MTRLQALPTSSAVWVCPNCPCWLLPHECTAPADVSNKLWKLPQLICTEIEPVIIKLPCMVKNGT